MSIDRVGKIQMAIAAGGSDIFEVVPLTLRNLIKARTWEQHKDKNDELFTSFEAFVTHRLWQGLETTIDELKLYCRAFPDVLQMIDKEVGALPAHGEIGGGHQSRGSGRGATYHLKRLKRDRPDLAKKVIAGSANAAAIQAGFRKQPTGLDLLRKGWAKATKTERRIFLAEAAMREPKARLARAGA